MVTRLTLRILFPAQFSLVGCEMREIITETEVSLNQSAGPRHSDQLPETQDVSHLGGGHVHGGSGCEATDDDIVDDEGETAHSEQSYESLYDAHTEGDGSDDLQ